MVEAKVGTPIHLPMMIAAEEALERSRAAAAADGDNEMRDSMVAVLLAAVSLEAATQWVAEGIDPAFRASIEEHDLDTRWANIVERRDKKRPTMGEGLGQAVRNLSEDRNWIAHYPGRSRSTMATPKAKDNGKSEARAHFTAELAAKSIETATDAIAAIGQVWARAGLATGTGTAYDATVDTIPVPTDSPGSPSKG